ncbi:hypothetical protein [Nocardia mexicana]|uniref:hypothetical protein n=1 Tax=Nocardia mexicana TaxID=279262 RepID=UPI0011C05497|nr:hypothetical protein [Nocardia mexicana]
MTENAPSKPSRVDTGTAELTVPQDISPNPDPEVSGGGWRAGLSLTGAALLFLALRLLAVSHYDWRLAFSIAGTIGLGDVPRIIVATLMADPHLVGVVLAVLLPATVLHQASLGRPNWNSLGTMAALVVVAVFTIALVGTYRMWWVPALAVLIGAILATPLLVWRRDPKARRFEWLLDHTSVLMILAALALAATIQVPWVPLERIDTHTGTLQGYVLENPARLREITPRTRRRTPHHQHHRYPITHRDPTRIGPTARFRRRKRTIVLQIIRDRCTSLPSARIKAAILRYPTPATPRRTRPSAALRASRSPNELGPPTRRRAATPAIALSPPLEPVSAARSASAAAAAPACPAPRPERRAPRPAPSSRPPGTPASTPTDAVAPV